MPHSLSPTTTDSQQNKQLSLTKSIKFPEVGKLTVSLSSVRTKHVNKSISALFKHDTAKDNRLPRVVRMLVKPEQIIYLIQKNVKLNLSNSSQLCYPTLKESKIHLFPVVICKGKGLQSLMEIGISWR